MPLSPAPNARAHGRDFQHALRRALNERKAVVRPRVTFPQLAAAAHMSETTVKRIFKLDGEGRDADIDVPVLWALATAMGTSVEELVRQANALMSPMSAQEDEARKAMGDKAWAELQATRQSHQSQKRGKA